MIKGIGTDIVRVERFVSWCDNDQLLKRYFSPDEIQYCLAQGQGAAASLAARFAAREAFGKALGTGLAEFELKDVRVSLTENGKPVLNLGPTARKLCVESGIDNIHLSLSHERDYAIAMVVVE